MCCRKHRRCFRAVTMAVVRGFLTACSLWATRYFAAMLLARTACRSASKECGVGMLVMRRRCRRSRRCFAIGKHRRCVSTNMCGANTCLSSTRPVTWPLCGGQARKKNVDWVCRPQVVKPHLNVPGRLPLVLARPFSSDQAFIYNCSHCWRLRCAGNRKDPSSPSRKRPVRSRGIRLRREDATTTDRKRSVLLTSKEHLCMKC